MKKLSHLDHPIHFANIAALAFALGSPIAAGAVENPSLSELSAQIEDLTKKLHSLDVQVNEQRTETHYVALENREAASPKQVRVGRNKIRSRQIAR